MGQVAFIVTSFNLVSPSQCGFVQCVLWVASEQRVIMFCILSYLTLTRNGFFLMSGSGLCRLIPAVVPAPPFTIPLYVK